MCLGVGYIKIDGKFVFVFFVFDLCKCKEMEDVLCESEVKFRSFILNIFGMVYCCLSMLGWFMVFISDVVIEVIGYLFEDFILFNLKCFFIDFYYFDDVECLLFISFDVGVFLYEYRIVVKFGEVKWVIEYGV